MCVRPRDTTIEVIGDYLIMMRKAVQQQTSSNFLLSKLDSPRTLSRPRPSLNDQILRKIHFQSHLASSISQPRRGRGSKFVVRRSSSNLVDSLIDSSLKSKGTVKIPTMHISYFIGSSTEQTRTHLLNSCL